ncbi:MAG: DUF1156 domain-containing protein [Aureliella sp.]
MSTYRKKLIEVALPLEAINKASAREKSIRHGHPSTLHLWWARRPLAACRAVLFASLVNDPEDDPMYSISEDTAYTERAKLFDLIEDLVQWENSNNPRVINAARLEIARSIAANKVADKELADDTPLVASAPPLPEDQQKYLPDPPPEYTAHDIRFKMPSLKPEQVNHFLAHYAPPVLDPFAGGGSIPLEAQRLGLRAYASDLNPVPVLINKALIEIPPKFAGMPPVNPDAQKGKLKSKQWNGAEGLAEDVRYFGKWMRDEAEKRIGHLYPKVKVTQEMIDDGRPDLEPYVGQELTVMAWIWARTVPSSNPAYSDKQVPLMSTFALSTKKSRYCWIEPEVSRSDGTYTLRIKTGSPSKEEQKFIKEGNKIGRGCQFRCLLSGDPMPEEHVKACGVEGRLGSTLVALVAQGNRERVYLPAAKEHEQLALEIPPVDEIDDICVSLANEKRALWCVLYGLDRFDRLFTNRQLLAMRTFSDLVVESLATVTEIASKAMPSELAQKYAEAVATYLAFSVSKFSDRSSSICTWFTDRDSTRPTFARQGLPMSWDFAETNTLLEGTGTFAGANQWTCENLDAFYIDDLSFHSVRQADARVAIENVPAPVVSTDPPYYDNIGYSDLSDFFYVWLRRSLKSVFPKLFSTVVTPKSSELIASPYRHAGGAAEAKSFFENGLLDVLKSLRLGGDKKHPLTIYYAFKQAETTTSENGQQTASTGWETMLTGVIGASFSITGTWPLRTELSNRMVGTGSNALASSIVLVCRPRDADSQLVTRRDFANALRKELPEAIKHLQSGNVAPVDLAQASIGPGMAVFSRYRQVANTDGSPMTVREALQLINQVLDESLAEQESDFDLETRFALRWFDQYAMKEGPYGDAETLATAMAVSVSGIVQAGIAKSGGGKVRLLTRDELDDDWDPVTDARLTMWEVTQHLIRRLAKDGETGAATLLARLTEHKGSEYVESVRELSYRLYQTCERAKRAEEARAYNGLVVAWPEIAKLARENRRVEKQSELFQ